MCVCVWCLLCAGTLEGKGRHKGRKRAGACYNPHRSIASLTLSPLRRSLCCPPPLPPAAPCATRTRSSPSPGSASSSLKSATAATVSSAVPSITVPLESSPWRYVHTTYIGWRRRIDRSPSRGLDRGPKRGVSKRRGRERTHLLSRPLTPLPHPSPSFPFLLSRCATWPSLP